MSPSKVAPGTITTVNPDPYLSCAQNNKGCESNIVHTLYEQPQQPNTAVAPSLLFNGGGTDWPEHPRRPLITRGARILQLVLSTSSASNMYSITDPQSGENEWHCNRFDGLPSCLRFVLRSEQGSKAARKVRRILSHKESFNSAVRESCHDSSLN